jgi:phospholipid/cholesterol/gamma-HCH transport system substrate-binding protein
VIGHRRRCAGLCLLLVLAAAVPTGCGWRGVNSLPLPGTNGAGPGSYEIQAQLPDVTNIQQNSRVRVGDVTVGNVTTIQRQGWHALLTMRVAGDVKLPANATAKVGQTSLLGSLHIELAPPTDEPPRGELHNGSLIPLPHASSYPTTEQTLAAIALLFNGGGLGKIQDITKAFSVAFAGHDNDLRSLIEQFDQFVTHLNEQTNDMITATDKFNDLVGKFADQKPVLDRAIKTIPEALAVLAADRTKLADMMEELGKFSALTADAAGKTKQSLVTELRDLGPVLESLANAGPDMTRSLSVLATYPWPNETLENWVRGDYGNATGIFDLTLSRLDELFTGTHWEGNLTELELQWGRTIGQLPSPYTAENPLIVPYHFDEGP